jgi:hypothetical protein
MLLAKLLAVTVGAVFTVIVGVVAEALQPLVSVTVRV